MCGRDENESGKKVIQDFSAWFTNSDSMHANEKASIGGLKSIIFSYMPQKFFIG